jgi:hypothetical protein
LQSFSFLFLFVVFIGCYTYFSVLGRSGSTLRVLGFYLGRLESQLARTGNMERSQGKTHRLVNGIYEQLKLILV